jgi:hypothetical protein
MGDAVLFHFQHQVIGAGMAQSVWRLGCGLGNWGLTSGGAGKFSLHRVQTGCGAHSASYSMGTGGPFPKGRAAGA